MGWKLLLRRGLFVLFLVPLMAFLAATVVGISGVAEGQGLAGPAVVLGWAIVAAIGSLGGGIFLVRRIPPDKLDRINGMLALILGVSAMILGYRFLNNKHKPSLVPHDPPPVTKPMSFRTGDAAVGPVQVTAPSGY